ncbi:MFS transporter [Xanthobacter autotrophicus]|uniref:MFS transporter n=1 Tax=Xanthobacter autotrophicus TaxID=280 RepID=UPI0024A74717|nr:MFS transporter [Xanthobacter autotrophicus]MDI4655746.1 MFS transporter [Xanthobacter autotrophicus]
MPQAPAPPPSERLRDHPAFLLFCISRIASAFAYQILGVAVGWLIYSLTGSAVALGLVGLAQFLPLLLFSLIAGHAADVFDRRRIVVIGHAVAAVTLALLAFGLAEGMVGLVAIYVAVVVHGACRAFVHPTMAALLPRLVPGELLPRALAVSSSSMQIATITGPAAGGFAYAFGATAPLAGAALCYAAAALTMMAVRHTHAPAPRSAMTLATLVEGLAFIRGHKVVLGSISLDLFAVLLGGVTALLPIFAADILHVGAQGLGALRAAPAVGAMLMAMVLARMSLSHRVGHMMFAAVVVFGLATVVFSLSSSFLLSLGALFVLGAADNVSVVIRSSLVQLSTPDAMRGRVSAVNSLFIGTSNQLGEFESGMAAALLGAVGAGVAGGVGTILVAVLWMRLFPDLLKVDRMPARPARTHPAQTHPPQVKSG